MNEILTIKDTALYLKSSESQVRKLISNDKIEAKRIGNQWLIKKNEVENYIINNGITIEPDDHPRQGDEIPEVVALSFFSGALGLDIGLSKAGINPLLVCEIDKNCRRTIQANKPDVALIGDIREYSVSKILEFAKIPRNRKVDLIVGGPPCQAFSTAGSRKAFDDDRGNVFLDFIQMINKIKPTYFIIENVRGLLSTAYPINGSSEPVKGGALYIIYNLLSNAGYKITFNLYNSANFGSPQSRERVIIFGSLDGTKIPYLVPTNSEQGEYNLPQWRTLSDALVKIPENTKHTYIEFPEKRLKYFRLLKEGQNWRDLPDNLQKEAMGKSYYLGGGKTGFLRRLSFNKPSPTLVTHPAMPATDLAHPIEDRPLSVEEYAAIQGFPSDWKICGPILERYKQLGNAVPTELGFEIGRHLLNHMNNSLEIPYYLDDFRFSRYKNTNEKSWLLEFERKNNRLF